MNKLRELYLFEDVRNAILITFPYIGQRWLLERIPLYWGLRQLACHIIDIGVFPHFLKIVAVV